jgi:dihydropteroate synthase
MNIGGKFFDLNEKTLVMGILNVTPDSFSDGGNFENTEDAVYHAMVMQREGADIIDVGGESTRPGAKQISIEEELNRVIPVVEHLVKKLKIPVSVDTYKSEVAKQVLDLGADMINDITALRGDEKLVKIISDYNVPVCLMHMKGTPQNMQIDPEYDDVVLEIKDFLKERVEYAISNGVKKENIIVDPGLGFGKRTGQGIEDNSDILGRLREIKSLGYPVLIGASRKTFIGNLFGKNKPLPVEERLEGSLAAATLAVLNGANIIRAHDVLETRECVDLIDRIRN